MLRREYDVQIDEIDPFETGDGFVIRWSGNIGWGEYTIYKTDGGKWKGESECMDCGEDKEFLKALLKYLVDVIEIVE